ncbi:MAG: phospho-N-acetylmuramoyl-pentapeptide-transferase [Muribaculaceae bacterium]|nr:phospho-N-acetylmuramoyl-pentapeptide-transferase [Muribaculaceae bacterium]
MFYSIFESLAHSSVPGARLMSYLSFRSGLAFVLSLIIGIWAGSYIIRRLRAAQVAEKARALGIEGEDVKSKTPTMGGLIILVAILVPCLLIGDLSNGYMLLMLLTTVWLGVLGFMDDYKKLKKRDKKGLAGKYKIIAQVGIGIIVATTMYLNPDMVIVENSEVISTETQRVEEVIYNEGDVVKSPQTTIPFVKNNNFNYSWLTDWMGGEAAEIGGWIIFLLVSIFFVAATSNGANLNDGLDGLCSGLSAISGVALMAMAYLGGNIIYSSYLNIMYVPGSGELVVFMAAFVGALVGFLWYNSSPASVFMGDTGSLTLGGIIAVCAILIHKELLLPVLCLLFYLEDLSVIIQTSYFKATGGKRVFKMTPLHHHFQKDAGEVPDVLINRPHKRIVESKIVMRFWIIGMILAVITFVTLKIR